jgi:hypothetical protein
MSTVYCEFHSLHGFAALLASFPTNVAGQFPPEVAGQSIEHWNIGRQTDRRGFVEEFLRSKLRTILIRAVIRCRFSPFLRSA